MPRYVRKPFELQAVQWTGNYLAFAEAWRHHGVDIETEQHIQQVPRSTTIFVHGKRIRSGDYVSRRKTEGRKGEFVVYGKNAFESQFELAA